MGRHNPGFTMKRFRLVGLTLCLGLSVFLAWTAAAVAQTSSSTTTSGCAICDCNDSRTLCKMNCQTSYTDPSAKLRCEVSCTKTYASCVDTAYATARALQQSSQQSTSTSSTTTSSGSVSSGS